jgi:sec-independent protein translocase protein TatA
MGSLSIWHWIVVVVVVLLLFGRGKISELMGDMAQGIKAFKKGMSDDDAKAEAKPDPMKTINAQTDMKREADTAKKFETGAL